MSNRAAGAHAANAIRMLVNAQRSEAVPSAQSIVVGDGGTAHQDDGTAASAAAALAPFPFEKHNTDRPMPALDSTLVGKQLFCVVGTKDGAGFRFVQLKVTAYKAKQLNDATGSPKEGKFRFRLVNGTVRVDIPEVHLRTTAATITALTASGIF